MPHRLTITHEGRTYTVERDLGVSAGPGAPPGTGRWFITLAGTAVTSLASEPDDTEERVIRRVTDWLDRHRDLRSREDIHLGGG